MLPTTHTSDMKTPLLPAPSLTHSLFKLDEALHAPTSPPLHPVQPAAHASDVKNLPRSLLTLAQEQIPHDPASSPLHSMQPTTRTSDMKTHSLPTSSHPPFNPGKALRDPTLPLHLTLPVPRTSEIESPLPVAPAPTSHTRFKPIPPSETSSYPRFQVTLPRFAFGFDQEQAPHGSRQDTGTIRRESPIARDRVERGWATRRNEWTKVCDRSRDELRKTQEESEKAWKGIGKEWGKVQEERKRVGEERKRAREEWKEAQDESEEVWSSDVMYAKGRAQEAERLAREAEEWAQYEELRAERRAKAYSRCLR